MKVIVAKSAGFCRGVQRAVDKARHLAREKKQPIYTDGPLIHNEQMMKQLQREGISESKKPELISDGILLVRAHGIPPERRKRLNNLNLTIMDTTCPDVARIQGLIRKYAIKGYNTVIFGDEGHAEVVGLLGFSEGKGHVVSSPEDISTLPEMDLVCMVSQSTQFPDTYKITAQAVKKRFPNAVILDTICDSTINRQTEVIKMAADVDVIVVVGSAHSANTMRLVELASAHKPTFHIETADDINDDLFRNYSVAGLTAGASTPDFMIREVKEKLERI